MKKNGFFAGVLVGAIVFGGTSALASSGILATLSPQLIYVDGISSSMTAYNIEGNNYVRLRDIGEAVDFQVEYDSSMNAVLIDSDSPYVEEPVQEQPVISDGLTTHEVDGYEVSFALPEGWDAQGLVLPGVDYVAFHHEDEYYNGEGGFLASVSIYYDDTYLRIASHEVLAQKGDMYLVATLPTEPQFTAAGEEEYRKMEAQVADLLASFQINW